MILAMFIGILSLIIYRCYGNNGTPMDTSTEDNYSATINCTSIQEISNPITTATLITSPNTSPITNYSSTISPTSLATSTTKLNPTISSAISPTAYTIKIHWALVVIGGVLVAILFIAVISCMVLTGLVAKGINFLIQYLSDSARANGEYDIQPHQQQPQKEGSLHILFLISVLVEHDIIYT